MVPMLVPLTTIVTGILLCQTGAGTACAIVAATAAVVMAVRRRRAEAVVCAMLTAAIVGTMARLPNEFPPDLEGKTVYYGCVIERIREHDANITLNVTIDSVNGRQVRPFTASITVPTFDFKPQENDRVTVHCCLGAHRPETDLPDEIDPSALRRGSAAGFTPADSFGTPTPEPGFYRSLRRMRADVSHAIFQCGMKSETSAFVNAVLTGDTSALDTHVRRDFAKAGIAHILALSGLHLALIAWMTGVLLYPLFPSPSSRRRSIAVIAVIWVFATATGLSPSVIRAAVMVTVLLAGRALQRRHSPFNSLFLAASLILMADPEALFSAGFQLTVAAVAAILTFTPLLDRLPDRHRALRGPLAMVGVPLAAMTGTALISVYHFHTLPVHFLGANILTTWLVAPLMVTGAAAAATKSAALCGISDEIYRFINSIASAFASLPGNDNVFYPTASGVVLGCMAIAIAVFAVIYRRPSFILPAFIAVALWGVVEVYDKPSDSPQAIYFARSRHSLDIIVRHGNRLLISTTAAPRDHDLVASRAAIRYSRYIGRRGIAPPEIVTDFQLPHTSRHSDTLLIGQQRFCLLGKEHPLPAGWRGIPIATSRFRGNITRVIRDAMVDTVMISADMNPRRAARYAATLAQAGYTAIDMRRQPISYTLY